MNWVNHEDNPPQPGTKVWYYFEITGVSQGEYHGDNCYGGKRGFLCDDVTHWQYDVGQNKPEPPNEMEGKETIKRPNQEFTIWNNMDSFFRRKEVKEN